METLAGGEIKDNDWLVTGGHKFFVMICLTLQ